MDRRQKRALAIKGAQVDIPPSAQAIKALWKEFPELRTDIAAAFSFVTNRRAEAAKRSIVTPAMRKAIGLRMKKYWAKKRQRDRLSDDDAARKAHAIEPAIVRRKPGRPKKTAAEAPTPQEP